jgi:hypothetical protein
MVRGYVGYQEWPGKPMTRRRVARPGAALILAFGDRIGVRDSSETLPLPLGAFVVGPQARSSFTDIDGHQHGVQVELSDAGAVTLFGDVSTSATPRSQLTRPWAARQNGWWTS